MDLGHIALRCLISYVFLLLMLRLRGKRAVAQASAFDFVLALIVGDLVDDAVWADVPVTQFLTGVATLFAADTLVSLVTSRLPSGRLTR